MLGNHFAMDHNFVTLPHTANMEFMYDIDMLEMIRWPYVEGLNCSTQELIQYMTFCRGHGQCRGPGPYQYIGPYRGIFPEDSGNCDSCSDCDDTLMVTSNDALRFEEDCLFESLPPSRGNAQSPGAGVDASADSNRFLCQKNSMADMTLAQLNDTSTSDFGDKTKLVSPKIEPQDQNIDPLNENFVPSSSKVMNCLLKKEQVLSLKQSSDDADRKPLLAVKTEQERCDALKYHSKREHSSPIRCTLKIQRAAKRPRTSSFALDDSDSKVNNRSAGPLQKPAYQNPESFSSGYSNLAAEKTIKLEKTDNGCGENSSTLDPLPSKTIPTDAENANSDDDFSDAESVLSKGSSVPDLLRSGNAEKRYFWQYNIQAKGPKEKRLCRNVGSSDPHVLKNFEDPVFDPGHSNVYFVHGGKARKGDGTDITPNPQKLLQIGTELKALNSSIEEMMQSSDLVTRMTTIKEKNKYASRVCRLKKKAQHEANKIKLQGLNEEHNQLMFVLNSIKSKLKKHKNATAATTTALEPDQKTRFTEELDNLTKSNIKAIVAGHADDYVGSILLCSSTDDQKDVWLYSD